MADKKGFPVAAMIGLAVAGVGALVLLGTKKKVTEVTEFRNLQAKYDGTSLPVFKTQEQVFTVILTFGYTGAKGKFDVGVGLFARSKMPQWNAVAVELPQSPTWKEVQATVTGKVPSTTGMYNVLKFIQSAGGDRDASGKGFLLADWDKNVYSVIESTGSKVTDLNVAYKIMA